MEILTLAWTFFKIGIVSFGGGWTIVGIIKREIMAKGWLTERVFTDVVAIAQVTPGPVSLNAATLVGFRVAGLVGALAASLAVVAFPMLAVALVTILIRRSGLDEQRMIGAFKVATVPLVAMTLLSLGVAPGLGWHVWLIAAVSCGLSLFTKIDPMVMILGSGAIGVAISALGL